VALLVLFAGSVVAAAVSGAVGFGGALLLLPLLTRSVGPAFGVPLLAVAQLVGNSARAAFGLRRIAWRPAALFLSLALPSAVAGSYCFVALPKSLVVRAIGVVILVFVGLRWWRALSWQMTPLRLAAAGAVVGFLSGLVGSAGPLGAAAFLALDLSPASYIATEATTAVAMHTVKLLTYQHFMHFDARACKLAAVLAAGMIIGTWVGKRTVERLPAERFRLVVGCLLVALAVQMIITG
jgi:uncharacterized membrane protein YfcA